MATGATAHVPTRRHRGLAFLTQGSRNAKLKGLCNMIVHQINEDDYLSRLASFGED